MVARLLNRRFFLLACEFRALCAAPPPLIEILPLIIHIVARTSVPNPFSPSAIPLFTQVLYRIRRRQRSGVTTHREGRAHSSRGGLRYVKLVSSRPFKGAPKPIFHCRLGETKWRGAIKASSVLPSRGAYSRSPSRYICVQYQSYEKKLAHDY